MPLVLEPYRQQIVALCRRFHVRRLEVFGSALRDDFNPARSDVDFLVEFRVNRRGDDLHTLFASEQNGGTLQAGGDGFDASLVSVEPAGVELAADWNSLGTPETYVGYARAENFVSPGAFARDSKKTYAIPKALALNQWALAGPWQVAREHARLDGLPARAQGDGEAGDLGRGGVPLQDVGQGRAGLLGAQAGGSGGQGQHAWPSSEGVDGHQVGVHGACKLVAGGPGDHGRAGWMSVRRRRGRPSG